MTHEFARRALLAGMLLGIGAGPAQAQGWFDSYRTFSWYLENDALAAWRGDESTDRSFTQGMRLTWQFGVWPEWARRTQRLLVFGSALRDIHNPCTPQHERFAGGCGSVQFGLAQTMYSPDDIITTALQPGDQPYAGWLFGTAGITARAGRWQSATELVAGVVGPASLARDTQSLAHWTWATGSPRPSGWHHQLRGSIHGGLIQTYGFHLYEKCMAGDECLGGANEARRFDLSVRSEAVALSLMARGSLGLTVRAGKNFPDALGARIPATGRGAADTRWWLVFASADGRGVLYNGFIEGTYADRGADGWRAVRRIEARRWINEISGGIGFGNNAYGIFVQAVTRSLEWDPVGAINDRSRHHYLSLNISLNHGR